MFPGIRRCCPVKSRRCFSGNYHPVPDSFRPRRLHYIHSVILHERLRLWRWAGKRIRYSDWLRTGRSGDRVPVIARFSAPVQTVPGTYPASCTMGTVSFSGGKCGREVTLTPPHTPFYCRGQKGIEIYLRTAWTEFQCLNTCEGCTVSVRRRAHCSQMSIRF